MTVPVVMPMTMVVARVGMPVRLGGIGAGLGLEGGVGFGDDQVHAAQQAGQHRVGLELQVVDLQFHAHVAVAQLVGGAQQIAGAAVMRAVAHLEHQLRRGQHAHQAAVFGHQRVAAAQDLAVRQGDVQVPALAVGGLDAAARAGGPVELDRRGPLEQDAGQPRGRRGCVW
jgi:hypothetical protein